MQIDIQTRKITLTRGLKRRIQQRLQFALDIKDAHIRRVKVWLSDINGPRGGQDKCCHIQVELDNAPDVVVKDTKNDFYAAIDRAAHRAAQTVVKKLSRLRSKGRVTSKQTRPWMALPQPGQ